MPDAGYSQPEIQNSSTAEQISQYLTAELEALNARAIAAEHSAAGKVNFYLLTRDDLLSASAPSR